MVSDLFFYQLGLIALVWLCVMLQWAWPSDTAVCPPPLEPTPLLPKRHREPTPFAGLTTKGWRRNTVTLDSGLHDGSGS
jgi:hypothetical protein